MDSPKYLIWNHFSSKDKVMVCEVVWYALYYENENLRNVGDVLGYEYKLICRSKIEQNSSVITMQEKYIDTSLDLIEQPF